ncbi:MAG: C4-dicarboxylate ABC transporter substrate-binding protein [Rhodospirillaceae bacterium]|jgi:TRAP-type C4-dicarboxylate transport system substrate-binding protein|uniref:TRAP transporter substrate-binding protein n=1 Tax=unclassified Hwanghaeella TaxID=2605944 RepID=UPI000C358CF7|nr:C4-dicarboxylate ABC transporter substrate-binding protein [Rhodospirillales bacterium]MAX47791.1 C4-dicarboxylate ABC transporter substrate-binding protein [Rhodospirillaceae bacterium]|tara:strand:- start:38313 stop:39293 length:981 start_codon:yes stop_codon:yes gene_type:complete
MSKLTTVLAAAALAFSPVIAQAAEITWDMANEYNDTSIHAEGDKVFSQKLNELTNGAIEITHHFGGSIGFKSKDQLDAVADGALPIADTYVGPLGGIDPMFLLPSLPFLAKTPADSRKLYLTAKADYDAVFAANNQKLLWASPWPPSGIWAKKPVDSLDALANLKIRTYDANGTITLQEAGAAPIQLSWADVVPQLSTGGIDAVLTSAEGGTNAKFWEQLSHFTEVNYAMPLNMIHINLDVWNDLSDANKEAVLTAAKAAEDHVWAALEKRVEQNYAEMKANGLTVVTGVDAGYLEALNKAGEKARSEWLEKTGAKGQAILDAYLK